MIIGISGKKQAGKDTIGKIIQGLTIGENKFVDGIKGFLDSYSDMEGGRQPKWQIKWFAEPLKDIVCLLIGCTRKQLEDNDFKEKPLGKEWQVYRIYSPRLKKYFKEISLDKVEADDIIKNKYRQVEDNLEVHLGETTPRLLLQLIGTDCGRQIISPNIWVNALMSEYKPKGYFTIGSGNLEGQRLPDMPNWIITDVRFPNEVKAIEDRGGVIIRINRNIIPTLEDCINNRVEIKSTFLDGTVKSQEDFDKYQWENYTFVKGDEPYLERALFGRNSMNGRCGIRLKQDNHESEIALDNYKDFDFVINNDRDIEELIEQVKVILKILKII